MTLRLPSLIIYLLFISSAYADPFRPITAIGGGVLFVNNIGSTQNFPIRNNQQDELYSYQTESTAPTAGVFDLFLGVEQPLYLPSIAGDFLIQYGFDYHQPSVLTMKGVFTQGLDTLSSNTYRFQYETAPHQFLAEAKLMYQYMPNVNPYVLVGIGGSLNSSSQYTTNVPPFLTFTREYQNNSNGSFSYAVGAGVDWEVVPSWRLGVAWRFNDFGTAELGGASINSIPVSDVLSLSNIYANELLFQLSKLW